MPRGIYARAEMSAASLRANLEASYIPEPNSGCWLWEAGVAGQYGRITLPGRKRGQAHRALYEFHCGPIPDGLELDHLCKLKLCVNPAHLEPVTHQENVHRGPFMQIAGRYNRIKTHCIAGHPYDVENTMVQNDGSRVCRICRNASQRRRWHMKRNR